MIILGIVLLIIGFAAKIAAISAIGIIAVVTGAVLALPGMAWHGRARGRRAQALLSRRPWLRGRQVTGRQLREARARTGDGLGGSMELRQLASDPPDRLIR